jgi:hypothetical protein
MMNSNRFPRGRGGEWGGGVGGVCPNPFHPPLNTNYANLSTEIFIYRLSMYGYCQLCKSSGAPQVCRLYSPPPTITNLLTNCYGMSTSATFRLPTEKRTTYTVMGVYNIQYIHVRLQWDLTFLYLDYTLYKFCKSKKI